MRRRHPSEPDRNDERRTVCELVYSDAVRYLKRGERIPSVLSAALHWLGYRVWMLPNNGFTPPETPRRREKFVRELQALNKPYGAEVLRHVNAVGYSRPPDREAERKFEYTEPYVEIDGDTISWGLKDTLERDLIFHARYDIVRLRVIDGSKALHEITRRPKDDGWGFTESMSALGLTDDDYRFEFWCLNSAGGSRSRRPFDFAEVAGVWSRLEYQGADWDGEWEGSQRTHTDTPQDAQEPAPVAVSDSTRKWVQSRANRYGNSRSTGKFWRELAEATKGA